MQSAYYKWNTITFYYKYPPEKDISNKYLLFYSTYGKNL